MYDIPQLTDDEHRFFAFLKEHGADKTPHAHSSLFDHLRGTYALLRAWNCSEAVCRAGLFHSIYGTSVFPIKTLTDADREKVRQLIGAEAEELSHLFSSLYRPQGLIDAITTGTAHRVGTKEAIHLSKEQLADLLTIEVANLLDQGGAESLLRQVTESVKAKAVRLPPGAEQAILAC